MKVLFAVVCLAVGSVAVNSRLKEVFSWKTVEYVFPNPEDREAAIKSGTFKPENNLPLGLDVWKNKLFITVPRWKSGVVSSLNYIDITDLDIPHIPSPDPDDADDETEDNDESDDDEEESDTGLLEGVGDLVVGDNGVLDTVGNLTAPLLGENNTLLDGVGDLLGGEDGLLSTVDDLTEPLLGGVTDLVGGEDGVLDSVTDLVAGEDGLLSTVDDLTEPLLGGVTDLVGGEDGLLDGVTDLVDGVDGLLDGVTDVVGGENGPLGAVTDLVDGVDGLLDGVTDVVGGEGGPLGAVTDLVGEEDGLLGNVTDIVGGEGGPLGAVTDLVGGEDGLLGNVTDLVGGEGGPLGAVTDLVGGEDGLLGNVTDLVGGEGGPLGAVTDLVGGEDGLLGNVTDLVGGEGGPLGAVTDLVGGEDGLLGNVTDLVGGEGGPLGAVTDLVGGEDGLLGNVTDLVGGEGGPVSAVTDIVEGEDVEVATVVKPPEEQPKKENATLGRVFRGPTQNMIKTEEFTKQIVDSEASEKLKVQHRISKRNVQSESGENEKNTLKKRRRKVKKSTNKPNETKEKELAPTKGIKASGNSTRREGSKQINKMKSNQSLTLCSGRNPCGIPEPEPIYAVVTLIPPSELYSEKKENKKKGNKKKKDKKKKKKCCKQKKKPKKPCLKPAKVSATSPALIPYPSLEANTPSKTRADATTITSVFRVRVDPCDRLWVMDTGVADILGQLTVHSKPQILVYNLQNDELVRKYVLKDTDAQENSFFANIIVDVTKDSCSEAFAYIPDLSAYAVNVYDFKNDKMWRIKHNYFHFNPLEGNYNVGGINFQWNDGVFSLALTSPHEDKSRTAYFHAMSSTSLFEVNTRVLQNEAEGVVESNYTAYSYVGTKGPNGQTSASFIHEPTGVMFYTQVNKDAIYCWNTKTPFELENLQEVASDSDTMIFPNDLKVDYENQLWVLTDKLPIFAHKGLKSDQINYRIFVSSVADAIKDTKCVP